MDSGWAWYWTGRGSCSGDRCSAWGLTGRTAASPAQSTVGGGAGPNGLRGRLAGEGALRGEGTLAGIGFRADRAEVSADMCHGACALMFGGGASGAGSFRAWRADNGSAAGTWQGSLTGMPGTGTALVDEQGVLSAKIPALGAHATLQGVVTTDGEWMAIVSGGGMPPVLVRGRMEGGGARGSWQDRNGLSGGWSATKQ